MVFTENTFEEEVMNSDVPVLVDFWAPWCPPCNAMTPVIEKIASEFEGRAKVGKVNVNEETPLSTQFNIASIPALIFFKDGKVVKTFLGFTEEKVLKETLESLL